MKKYLVIGNPIDHSLSPKLHNYWIKNNNINAIYEKKKLDHKDIGGIISQVRKEEIQGLNVTVPFKKSVIEFLDELSLPANETQSVNTIYKENKKIIGHNTDVIGFELAIKRTNFNLKNKKIFILGAGGVVPSIIVALKKMGVSKIILSNRTIEKAENLKKKYTNLEVIEWGQIPDFNMIINATSLGLKKNDDIKLDYATIGNNKFFYDIIYNPNETNFLAKAKVFGHQIENGKMMFVHQAHQAFAIWHKILPSIDGETINFLNK